MRRWLTGSAIVLGLTLAAGPAGDGLGLRPIMSWLGPPAAAIVGMPLTPVSAAGVARRTVRRPAYVAGAATVATAAVATTAAVTTAAVATAAVGSMVAALPGGCASAAVGGVVYYNCGGVFYQPHYQGANLVYVVVPTP
jgi:hypothetical protein